MTLTKGQLVLDRYEVGELLGEGGMGQVFLGHHKLLDMPVAIKTMLGADEEMLGRFDREARLMARVRHPNVVSVLDYGFVRPDLPCIVMEFAPGRPLDACLQKERALPFPRAVAIVQGILAGLDALHRLELLHRDLKPANVIIADDGSVKLIDLGIARSLRDNATRYTQANAVLGTPAYMPPEQLMGFPLDARSDLYACGIVLYELLCGDLPCGGADDFSAVLERAQTDIPAPKVPAGFPALPPALCETLASVLKVSPKKRPASAREMAERLAACLGPSAVASPSKLQPRQVAPSAPQPAFAPAPERKSVALPPAGVAARGLVVAKLPPSRLSHPEERKWLTALVTGRARPFVLGGSFFCALELRGSDDPSVLVRDLREALRGRYGSMANIAASAVDDSFVLTAAQLSGAQELPEQLLELVASLS